MMENKKKNDKVFDGKIDGKEKKQSMLFRGNGGIGITDPNTTKAFVDASKLKHDG